MPQMPEGADMNSATELDKSQLHSRTLQGERERARERGRERARERGEPLAQMPVGADADKNRADKNRADKNREDKNRADKNRATGNSASELDKSQFAQQNAPR